MFDFEPTWVKELRLEEIRQRVHEHPLTLVDLQLMHRDYEEDDDDYDDNDMIAAQNFKCLCNMCGRGIDWYHRYYYKCSMSCDYKIHQFCTNFPATLQFLPHPAHTLILEKTLTYWYCDSCRKSHKWGMSSYRCSICDYRIDLECATFVEHKTIHYPYHPHPLKSFSIGPILSKCSACNNKHEGDFYHCTTCLNFSIHSDCVSLPIKLLLDNHLFSHRHLLTLSYSFLDQLYDRECRICGVELEDENVMIYKCTKCLYYVHPDCATQRVEPFMSILLPGLGKTEKNYKDADYPELRHYPLPEESCNMLPHQLIDGESSCECIEQIENEEDFLIHDIHKHSLVPIHDKINTKSMSLHDPMKRIKLLCNGCIRPITTIPFYKCSREGCDFVLHDWCTRLRTELESHEGSPWHKLRLIQTSKKLAFTCYICQLPCNGFSYHCSDCNYRIDVNCGFTPREITHEAHPNHLLTRVDYASSSRLSNVDCRACRVRIGKNDIHFRCSDCDFYLHIRCALRLPRTIRHRCDKHALKLSYGPIEDHKSRYFCEVCEEGLNPGKWFYHCIECGQSIHSACAPLILQSEQTVNSPYVTGVYKFVNIKFGAVKVVSKCHPHPMSLVAGTKHDGLCASCPGKLQSYMIFKCLECKFGRHYSGCMDYMSLVIPLDLFGGYKHNRDQYPRYIAPPPTEVIVRPVTRHWKVGGHKELPLQEIQKVDQFVTDMQ